MDDVTVSLTPVTAGACVLGCLVLDRDALGLLPRNRRGVPRFLDQLRGLRVQVANKLMQDRLGNGLWGLEDRGPLKMLFLKHFQAKAHD
ncbi:hypothetical protein BGX24_007617, partial [Mortierella sp. AD032]